MQEMVVHGMKCFAPTQSTLLVAQVRNVCVEFIESASPNVRYVVETCADIWSEYGVDQVNSALLSSLYIERRFDHTDIVKGKKRVDQRDCAMGKRL